MAQLRAWLFNWVFNWVFDSVPARAPHYNAPGQLVVLLEFLVLFNVEGSTLTSILGKVLRKNPTGCVSFGSMLLHFVHLLKNWNPTFPLELNCPSDKRFRAALDTRTFLWLPVIFLLHSEASYPYTWGAKSSRK